MTEATGYESAVAQALVRNGRLSNSEVLFILTDFAKQRGARHPRKVAQQKRRTVVAALVAVGCVEKDGGISLR